MITCLLIHGSFRAPESSSGHLLQLVCFLYCDWKTLHHKHYCRFLEKWKGEKKKKHCYIFSFFATVIGQYDIYMIEWMDEIVWNQSLAILLHNKERIKHEFETARCSYAVLHWHLIDTHFYIWHLYLMAIWHFSNSHQHGSIVTYCQRKPKWQALCESKMAPQRHFWQTQCARYGNRLSFGSHALYWAWLSLAGF